MATGTPINKAIADWFVKKRGLALSTKFALQGLQGVVMLPLIAWLIIAVGWRTASLIGGLVMLAIGLPLVWFSIKQRRPEHYGLLPDGAFVDQDRAEVSQMVDRGVMYAAEVEEVEFTFRQGIRTLPYWLLFLAAILHGPTGSISIHLIPLLTDMGIDPLKAAAMMTTIYATSIPARLVGGFLADRVTKGRLCFLLAAIYLLQAAGYFAFVTSQTVSAIYIWFVLHGFGMGVSMSLMSALRARYFGRKAFGSLSGFSQLLNMPVGMAAPVLLGWVYDTTGSYLVAFKVIAVLIVLAAVVIAFARPPKPPLQTVDVRKIL